MNGGAIITFLSAVPGTLLPMGSGAPVPINGLSAGELVVAIDTRPATGDIVGVTSIGRLLRINPVNGQTLQIAQVSIAFAGNVAGFDFNPVDDRLRITTDTGQNLSVVPDTEPKPSAEQKPAAEGTVERYRELLRRELAVEPGPRILALVSRAGTSSRGTISSAW